MHSTYLFFIPCPVCVIRFVSQLSVAVCLGFPMAWSPYAIVSMWAAFGNPEKVPPMAFALAAMFAKSSTLYNPVIYLAFKPNFRRSLCRDAARFRGSLCVCQADAVQKDACEQLKVESARPPDGLPDSQSCRHCPEAGSGDQDMPQKIKRTLVGSLNSELTVSQLSNEAQSDFL